MIIILESVKNEKSVDNFVKYEYNKTINVLKTKIRK